MSKISKTFRIAVAMLVAAFSSNLLPAAAALAYPGTGNGTLHEVVCHAEGNGGWHAIPPAQTSNHIDANGQPLQNGVHKNDFLIYAQYPDGTKWNTLKKQLDAACAQGPTVEAAPVTFNDKCGTANDTFTVPEVEYVEYTQGSQTITAGTYPASGQVSISAKAVLLHKLVGTAEWSHTFTNESCDTQTDKDATPQAVEHVDVCGKRNDTYTIPTVEGVNYYVNGTLASAGTYVAPKNAPRSVIITTDAQAGYQLTEEYSETINFTNQECAKVTICHRTNSVTNPYVKITVSVNAVDGIAGNNNGKDHYGEHQGPIVTSEAEAQAMKSQGDKWGDIIPPVPPHHNGLNWPEGQAMLENDCNYIPAEPTPVTPEVPTAVNLCYNDSDYITIPETEGVIYKSNGQVVSGSVQFTAGSSIEITAEAAEGYALENYTGPWTFTDNDFASKDCLEIKKTFKSYDDTDHNGAFSIGDTITWTVTVTNNGDVDLDETFTVEVKDLGITIALENLGAGKSLVREVTTTLTSEDMRVCKATNTATFSGWRTNQEVSRSSQADVFTKAVNVPLATDSDSAEFSFTCGRGSYTPPKIPTDTKTPSAPNTGVASQVAQADPKSSATPILALIIVTLAYGALYFAQPRRKFER